MMINVKQVINELELLAAYFYRLEIRSGLKKMDQVLELLTAYLQGMGEEELSNQTIDEVKDIMELMLQFMQNRDYILLADYLQYELIPKLNSSLS